MIWLAVLFIASAEFVNPALAGGDNQTGRPKPTILFTASERAWLESHPEVRWGADPDWPPFSSFDRNGELVGIDADITRLVAARAGLQLVPIRCNCWSEVLEKAKAGQVDFLSATARLPQRVEEFDFTAYYGSFPVVIITRVDAPFLTPAPHLDSMRIAAVRDDVVTWRLWEDYPNAAFVMADTAEETLEMVAHGKAEAAVQNLAVASRIIRVNGLTNLKITGITRYDFPICFAVRKDAPELRSLMGKALATLTPEELERIYAAHLSPDVIGARDWGLWRRRALYSTFFGLAAVGAVLLWICSLERQIGHRKAAESALREARDELERHNRELDRRVKEVEKLNKQVAAAYQNLESFSASVSHDLRAPLRRVVAFAELLESTAGDGISKEARGFVTTIVNESTSMDRLIKDLLEFSRLDRVKVHMQPVNMRELIGRVIDSFGPQLQDRKIFWSIGELGEVFGDPNLLRYAMLNLIDNAIKYSRNRPETRITIDMIPGSARNGEAVFFVKDNGCGFDMKHAKQIFEPFQRLHNASEFEGTGIGLANVQRIIQKHNGRIWFESEPDKGATFYVSLPRPPLSGQ